MAPSGRINVDIARQIAVYVASAVNNTSTPGVSRGELARDDSAVVLVELIVGRNVDLAQHEDPRVDVSCRSGQSEDGGCDQEQAQPAHVPSVTARRRASVAVNSVGGELSELRQGTAGGVSVLPVLHGAANRLATDIGA